MELAQQDVMHTDHQDGATQGLSAMLCLQKGLEYFDSLERDCLVEAHMWFNIAYARGNKQALQYRQEVAAEMSHADIIEAQKKAREWLARNAN